MNYSIMQVLMERDGHSYESAREIYLDARRRVENGEDPEEILLDEFGLEPDYIFDLL